MRKIFKYQKPTSLIVLVSLFGLSMPQLPARGALVGTEDILNQDSTSDFDRLRIRSFVSRKDVIIQLQSYGISPEEALAQVDSLTDQEIALIAGKLDQLPIGGDAYSIIYIIARIYVIAQYAYYGAIIILIVMVIIGSAAKGEPL